MPEENVKTLSMKFSKSTKGTHVYVDETPNTPITQIYIKKEGLSSQPPQEIEVTFKPK